MFCKYCGAQIADQAEICPKCGLRVEEKRKTSEVDAPNIGFAILGFFFPVVGFVLYLVWLQELPLKAKSCGKGALISVIVSAALVVLYIIIFVILFASVAAAGALPAPT